MSEVPLSLRRCGPVWLGRFVWRRTARSIVAPGVWGGALIAVQCGQVESSSDVRGVLLMVACRQASDGRPSGRHSIAFPP